jgi:hypothetical protein
VSENPPLQQLYDSWQLCCTSVCQVYSLIVAALDSRRILDFERGFILDIRPTYLMSQHADDNNPSASAPEAGGDYVAITVPRPDASLRTASANSVNTRLGSLRTISITAAHRQLSTGGFLKANLL